MCKAFNITSENFNEKPRAKKKTYSTLLQFTNLCYLCRMKTIQTNILNTIQRHRLAWMWLMLYIAFCLMGLRHQSLLMSAIISAVTQLPMMLMWSALHFVLLPRLIARHKIGYYLGTMVLLFILVPLAANFDHYIINLADITPPHSFEETGDVHLVRGLFLHTKYTFLLLCTALTTTVNFLLNRQEHLKAEAIALQRENELKYLRAQINPHFLFNALNCIYALALTQDEKAPDSVLKLSEMLRYITDQSSASSVPIISEIHYISNYLDFQRIRMEHEPDVTFTQQVHDPDFRIPPMLLQPIVENCFKHSRIVDDPKAWIHLTLRQDATGVLFTAENSKPEAKALSTKDNESLGVGLRNVEQRLQMLFGDRSSLKVLDEVERYKVILHF